MLRSIFLMLMLASCLPAPVTAAVVIVPRVVVVPARPVVVSPRASVSPPRVVVPPVIVHPAIPHPSRRCDDETKCEK